MADDGISAVTEHDVPSAATDTEHPQTTGDCSVQPVVTADSCAATSASAVAYTSEVAGISDDTGTPDGTGTSEVGSAGNDTPPSVRMPLLSVDDALRSIARPTPISTGAPVVRAAEAVTRGCRRVAPLLLPSGLTHALAIAIGCAIGWHTRNVEDAVPTMIADAGADASDTVVFDKVDTVAFDAVDTFAVDKMDTVVSDATGTGLAPFVSARPIKSVGPFEPARVESRFVAPGAFVPSRDVTSGSVTLRPVPEGAPQPIEIPNDAVSLDAAESASATPAVVPAAANSSPANPAAVTAGDVTAAPAIRVVGVMTYTADDLRRALADAHEAIGCSHCQSTGRQAASEPDAKDGRAQLASHAHDDGAKTCSACGGMPAARFTSEGYESLCRLAEVATFVRVEADDTETWSVRDQSSHLLSVAIGERDRLNKTGRLAGFRLDDPARAHNGILLAGTVQKVSYLGSLYHSEIVLFGVPRRVTVISEREPPFSEGHRVVVLGAIVDRPVENLRGYQGEVQQVVWGGLPLVLSD